MYELSDKISKEYLPMVDVFFKKICEESTLSGRRIQRNHLETLKSSIKCFLRNYLMSNKRKMVISLDNHTYTSSVIVNGCISSRKISYELTIKVLNYLESHGYISLEKGGCSFKREKVATTMMALNTNNFKAVKDETYPSLVIFKDKFNDLFKDLGKQKILIENVIILKDEDGNAKPFKLNKEIKRSRDILKEYNKMSLTKVVMCGNAEYNVQTYRIFNLKQTWGGRMYTLGSIHSLSSEERNDITIDGKKVARFDFKAFEPSILYSLAGEEMVEDPYTLNGGNYDKYDPSFLRLLCKKAMLVMLNTKNFKQAAYCMNDLVREEMDIDLLYQHGKIPERQIPVVDIIKDLEDKHHKISHKFYNETWKEVQYLGSKIMQGVAEYLMQRYECMVLQVFDECIIEEEYAQELYEVMHMIYNEVTGFIGNCHVVREN